MLTLRRSILTEKVSRRGFHLSREYATDPLEIVFAREVTRTGDAIPEAILRGSVDVVVYPDEPLRIVVFRMAETGLTEVPVIGRRDGKVIGAIALADLLKARGRVLEAERRRERTLGKRLRVPRRRSGIV